jgi:hypothetical protein
MARAFRKRSYSGAYSIGWRRLTPRRPFAFGAGRRARIEDCHIAPGVEQRRVARHRKRDARRAPGHAFEALGVSDDREFADPVRRTAKRFETIFKGRIEDSHGNSP